MGVDGSEIWGRIPRMEVDKGRKWEDMGGYGRIWERLTPGPLTHLSLSLGLRSLSLWALSLSENHLDSSCTRDLNRV